MPVEFVPKSRESFCFGVSNRTWNNLVNLSPMKDIIGVQEYNDTIVVTAEQVPKLLDILKTWKYPIEAEITQEQYDLFLEFFETCESFYTY